MTARKKKTRRSRSPLTHFEVRRGGALRLRLAVADDALAEVGDELGHLFCKIAPGAVETRTVAPPFEVVDPSSMPADFAAVPHAMDDDGFHENLRERLTDLISSLCDASLADALAIVREEHDRRIGGVN